MMLYGLAGQYLQLLEWADDEEQSDAFLDTLEGLTGEIEIEAENVGKMIKTLEGYAASYDCEIKRLSQKKATVHTNIKRAKQALEAAMKATGLTKLKTPLFDFGIQKNPPALFLLDESKIPTEFWVEQEPTIDRKGLKDYLKEHGDQEYAQLKQGESLRIK